MTGGIAGKGAVVTGGGRGIGAAVAQALAAAGAKVVVVARTAAQVRAVAEALRERGAEAHAVACDVTDPASVRSMARQACERLGAPPLVLVNNAGASASAPFPRTSLDDWETLHRVNATGPFLCTQAFLPAMLDRRWGRIVNVASTAALAGAKYIAAYAASKHALLGMTRCLAAELAGTGVAADAVCPGYVDTPMTDENVQRVAAKTGRTPEAVRSRIAESQPEGRLLQPEEVARDVVACVARAPGAPPPLQASAPLQGPPPLQEPSPLQTPAPAYRIVNPPALGSPRGWNNGMLAPSDGRILFVAGQIATDSTGRIAARTLPEQFGAALANVAQVVDAASGRPADVGRLAVYVTDMDAYRRSLSEIGVHYRAVFGKHFPAMSLVAVSALVHPEALVEVEATAVIPTTPGLGGPSRVPDAQRRR